MDPGAQLNLCLPSQSLGACMCRDPGRYTQSLQHSAWRPGPASRAWDCFQGPERELSQPLLQVRSSQRKITELILLSLPFPRLHEKKNKKEQVKLSSFWDNTLRPFRWQELNAVNFPFIHLLELICIFVNSEQFPILKKKCLILNPL